MKSIIHFIITASVLISIGLPAGAFARPLNEVSADSSQSKGSLEINMTTGTFTATNAAKTYASTWESTQTSPTKVTLSISVNNMSKTASGQINLYYSNNGNYTISAGTGYIVTGYTIRFINLDANTAMSITPAGGSKVTCTSRDTATVKVTGLTKRGAGFTVSNAANAVKALTAVQFTVYYAVDSDPLRTTTLYHTGDADGAPYRIPSIAKTKTGDLIALSDKRWCKSDIGYGLIDVVARISKDNGHTWGTPFVVMKGNGISGDNACGYGDAAIVADGTSDTVLIISATGNVFYRNSTVANPLRVARCYSYDNGKTWTTPEDITSQIYGLFNTRTAGIPAALFFGSGRIFQSRTLRVGSHFRLYAALCTLSGNFVVFSDNLGRTWQVLGGVNSSPAPAGDEPKCEELPDGNILLSSRKKSGRWFNIYNFSNKATAAGSWLTPVESNTVTGGISVGGNSTNGEILRVKAIRRSDGQPTWLLLQSLPTADDRANVSIFYKELSAPSAYSTVQGLCANWTGRFDVSSTTSCYSTMILQQNDTIAFYYEESFSQNGYEMTYLPLSLERITGGAYQVASESFVNGIAQPQASLASTTLTAERGRVTMKSGRDALMPVFDVQGRLLTEAQLKAGVATSLSLPSGIYVIDHHKVVVR